MFDWITGLIAAGGVWGVALVMLLENLFPPIPSELIMPMAGFLAAGGDMTVVGVIIAGTFGSVLGALFWYWIGQALGEERFLRLIDRYGFLLTMSRSEAELALGWFRRNNGWAVFLGRMVPAVRTLISVPAGLSGMAMLPFLVITTLGSLIWVTGLTIAGVLLQANYARVEGWLDPGTTIVIGLIVAIYLFRVARGIMRRAG